jgi:hypothetical protein
MSCKVLFPPCDLEKLAKQTRMVLSSYRHWKGASLWPEDRTGEVLAREVFFAPFVLACSGTEEDPVLNYGNQKALDLWEMDWRTFTRTPGRQTAEPMEQGARDRFLETVKKQGYIDNYQGIRISSKGRRFEIRQATVWNLLDEKGRYAGQAASFQDFRFV